MGRAGETGPPSDAMLRLVRPPAPHPDSTLGLLQLTGVYPLLARTLPGIATRVDPGLGLQRTPQHQLHTGRALLEVGRGVRKLAPLRGSEPHSPEEPIKQIRTQVPNAFPFITS